MLHTVVQHEPRNFCLACHLCVPPLAACDPLNSMRLTALQLGGMPRCRVCWRWRRRAGCRACSRLRGSRTRCALQLRLEQNHV